MPTIVSRNTIKLANSASSVNDYYKGYNITVSSFDPESGKKIEQTKEIVGYNGALRVATIDGIWDADFIPKPEDTYRIVPAYPDSRVSTNFAVMTLDYITSKRYGKGLDPHKDLALDTWLESARICDTQSDVTVRSPVPNPTVGVGAVYEYRSGTLHWQGTVKELRHNNYFIRFTNILGKLTNKWNSWKVFKTGSIIYEGNNLYRAVSTSTVAKPAHTSGTQGGLVYLSSLELTKVSGSGPTSLSLVTNTNPVQDLNTAGTTVISGYSLYDSDGIDYWRYIGWDQHDQRFVTRHQGNLIVDTSVPLFDNINNLLEHFGGIMRYSAGKYSLTVEAAEGEIPNTGSEVRNITKDEIIGRIRLTDEGLRSSFNSLTVAYADPANKFEARNISFFNSEFLKSDRNVPKKGNLSIPGVTNYYNARLLADKFLVKSRYSLTISLNMSPRGALLNAGSVIQVQNDRYGWVNKKFRIENLTHNTDCTVDVVAKEYDDKFYLVSNISKPPAVGNAAESGLSTNLVPTSLTATNISSETETVGGIELKWPSVQDPTVDTEIYSSIKTKLVLIADRITSGSILRFNETHGLEVNDELLAKTGLYGFTDNTVYYVKTVVSPTEVTLSTSIAGSTLSLTNITTTNLRFFTGNIIATVPNTMNSYIDVINNSTYVEDPEAPPPEIPLTPEQELELERVRKYYWIRNKITRS